MDIIVFIATILMIVITPIIMTYCIIKILDGSVGWLFYKIEKDIYEDALKNGKAGMYISGMNSYLELYSPLYGVHIITSYSPIGAGCWFNTMVGKEDESLEFNEYVHPCFAIF